MQDRAWRGRTLGLSVALAGAMVATAAASILDADLVIVAPCSVVAGFPINGYVYGLEGYGTIMGTNDLGQKLGDPVESMGGETWYCFPTYEPMAGSVVTIRARDDDESATASVIVL